MTQAYKFNPFKEKINFNYAYSVRTAQLTHTVSVIKAGKLMFNREIIAVCSEIHTKHINTVCGRIEELLKGKPDGTYGKHRVGKVLLTSTDYVAYTAIKLMCNEIKIKVFLPHLGL